MHYIIYQGRKRGPLSNDQLKTLVSRGQIDKDTPVSLDEEDWKPLGETEACAHLLAFVPVPVPPQTQELRLRREPRPKPKPPQPQPATESQPQSAAAPPTEPSPPLPPLPSPSVVAVPYAAVTSDIKIVTELPPTRRPARRIEYRTNWSKEIALRLLWIPVVGVVSYAILIIIAQRQPESDNTAFSPQHLATAVKDRFSQIGTSSHLGNNTNEEVRVASERQARIAAEARANAAEARVAEMVRAEAGGRIVTVRPGITSTDEQFVYQRINNAITIMRLKDRNTAGALVIPATIEGCPVTSIENGAFVGCRGLTSVTIPVGVTSISRQAFVGCNNLTIYGTRGSEAEKFAERELGLGTTLRFMAR